MNGLRVRTAGVNHHLSELYYDDGHTVCSAHGNVSDHDRIVACAMELNTLLDWDLFMVDKVAGHTVTIGDHYGDGLTQRTTPRSPMAYRSAAPGSPEGSDGGLGGAQPPKKDPATVLPGLARTVIAKWILDANTGPKAAELAVGLAIVIERTSAEFTDDLFDALAGVRDAR